ncbi:MAG TPA: hypothetical protein VFI82_06265 [Terriglobales bacterium]|nr:hypothetical protein [Terriglobales bacterium]
MKRMVYFFALLFPLAVAAQTTYSNLDDSLAGWGGGMNCTGSCAGGASATIATNTIVGTPSVDGNGSMELFFNGPSWTDVLWWDKLGVNNTATNFTFDFYVQLYNSTNELPNNVQALEFDTFQFIKLAKNKGTEYMFGTQCDYGNGWWDVWNQQQGYWVATSVPCVPFQPNVWYHITWNLHRTPDKLMHYDNFSIVQYDTTNKIVSSHTYTLNMAYPSGPLPRGWDSVIGVQFQMDANANGGQMQEYVDRVSLTVQ